MTEPHDSSADGVTIPGFVDHHAHLIQVASGARPPWGDRSGVRRFHEQCAARGVTPVDDPAPAEAAGLDGRLAAALGDAARLGICELWEAGLRDVACLDALQRLRESGPLPVRVRLLVAAGLAEQGMPARVDDPWCDVVGVKFYADGWLGSRTCALSHGFEDEDGNRGIAFESALSLARRIEPLAEAGWLIATHAIGDRGIEAVLDAYEHVWGGDCARAAPRIEHVQLLRPDLVERMATLGVVACIQPGFGFDDHADAQMALGHGWPLAYRWGALLEAGVHVICGSDYPIDGLSPLAGLAKLIRNPFEQTPVETALELMTDARAGTVTLGDDPRSVDPERLEKLAVLSTTPSEAGAD